LRFTSGSCVIDSGVARANRLHDLGLPEYSALTIEGRIERAGMVADHLVRSERGLEKPVRRSDWRFGLQLILFALVAVIGLAVIMFLV
jgi:hypothetical protein